jgi:hypothetical protein
MPVPVEMTLAVRWWQTGGALHCEVAALSAPMLGRGHVDLRGLSSSDAKHDSLARALNDMARSIATKEKR